MIDIEKIMKRYVKWFDKEGKEINENQFSVLFENEDYKTVKRTVINDFLISTIWLGINHSFNFTEEETIPIIFETMIFDQSSEKIYDDLYMERYATEQQALEGHERACQMVRSGEINREKEKK